MPAESEGVVEGHFDFGFARFMRDVIEVAVGIGIVQIDRRRHNTIANGEGAGGHFDGAGCSEGMAGHRFGGTDEKPVSGVIPENTFDRDGFANVPQSG